MDEFTQETSVLYEDLEPLVEATVNDPLPADLVEQEWLDLPTIERDWLDLPEIEQGWLDLPDLDQEWMQALEPDGHDFARETPDLEQDLEH